MLIQHLSKVNPIEQGSYDAFLRLVDAEVKHRFGSSVTNRVMLNVMLSMERLVKYENGEYQVGDFPLFLKEIKVVRKRCGFVKKVLSCFASRIGPLPTEFSAPFIRMSCLHRVKELEAAIYKDTIDAKGCEEEEDLHRHSTHPDYGRWDCIGREETAPGCYIYEFRFRDRFHPDMPGGRRRNSKAIDDSYPAVDLHPYQITNWSFLRASSAYQPYFQILWKGVGFRYIEKKVDESIIDYYVKVPDMKTVQMNWEKLKTEGIVKHDLHLVPSDGIASHREYIDKTVGGAVVISNGVEFFHDMYFHVAPAIARIFTFENRFGAHINMVKNFNDIGNQFNKKVSALVAKIDVLKALQGKGATGELKLLIDHWRVLEAMVALYVDIISSIEMADNFFVEISKSNPDDYLDMTSTYLSRIFKGTLPANSPGAPYANRPPEYKRFLQELWTTFRLLIYKSVL